MYLSSISFVTVVGKDSCIYLKDRKDILGDHNVISVNFSKRSAKWRFEGAYENEKVASLAALEIAFKRPPPFVLNSKPVVTVFFLDRKFTVIEIPPAIETSCLGEYEVKSVHDSLNEAFAQARKTAIVGRCSLIFPKF